MKGVPLPGAGLLGRIRQLTEQALTPSVSAPGTSLTPAPPGSGLLSRVKQRTQEYIEQKLQGPMTQAPPSMQRPASGLSDIRLRLANAARALTKIMLLYHGKWRLAEPYSFRYRAKEFPHIPLLYAQDDSAPHIKAFNLEKIQDVRNTDLTYAPRWAVEIR